MADRRRLRRFATDLLAFQDECGAIRETLGGTEDGVASNGAFGKGESTLIQRNGDPVCDMLYTCNFALIGLHEAAAATGDPFYAKADDRLAKRVKLAIAVDDRYPGVSLTDGLVSPADGPHGQWFGFHGVDGLDVKARYVRVHATNIGMP